MANYILAHDIGTSSDKAVLVDYNGKAVTTSACPYPTFYPKPAWVEQNPDDYWEAVKTTTKAIIEKAGISPNDIKAIVFSTQAMGLIPVDESYAPLYNNISWVDGRAQKQAEKIMKKLGGKALFTIVAGTPIMGKDVIAKIAWLKEEKPEIYSRTKYFLDVNGYLKMKCTGVAVAELSGASSYGLDLKKKTWMSVLPLVGVDMKKLPPIIKSTDLVSNLTAKAAEELGLSTETAVFGGCDDVQSANIGSGQTDDGEIHIYLGTSAWVCATSKTKTQFKRGAAAIQSADYEMNLITGVTEAAGSNIEWVINQFFKHELDELGGGIFAHLGEIVKKIPVGSDRLICTPWMLGERCPVMSTTTRATLFNMSEEHTREHILRAIYEGIGYNLRWILENFRKDYGFKAKSFRIIGGGAQNEAWMQIIADITGCEFDVPEDPRNRGAIGAAITALIGLGVISDFKGVKNYARTLKSYYPIPANTAVYDKMFENYKNIYYGLEKAYDVANSQAFGN
ncbi:MAG: FGGY-family carbohydrate kinase [Christensenellaceae bacterium]|jgi:xylulokinase|nr:FGGY-family carbohydrate kinase [Christensenellaceae bacterium]